MKTLLLALGLIVLSIPCSGQIAEAKAIDEVFTTLISPQSPGASLGVFKDGQLVYGKGYGLANMEYDIPNDTQSVFRIGSTSKQFTAACVVLLAQQGKLSLEDPLSKHFPEFPDYADRITIRQLMNHTSGIRDYLQISYLRGMSEDDFYTDQEIMRWLVNQTDLNFEPGSEFTYSNSGYWLLGQLVNKVSGKNMAQFAQAEIFEPLGMTATHFHNDHQAIVKNRASGYAPTTDGGYQISMTTLDMIGDGGIFTSIEDILKWDNEYYERKLLNDAFWKEMTTTGKLSNGEDTEYGGGLFMEEYKGLRTISHGGAFVGFRAELLRFPDQKVSVAIFANRGDANPSTMAQEIADIILKDQFKDLPSEAVAEVENPPMDEAEMELDQLVGTYEVEPGVEVVFSISNDSLHAKQKWNGSEYNLYRETGNRFKMKGQDGLSFTFTDLKDGLAQELTVMQGNRPTQVKRKEEKDLSGVNPNDYIGTYFSPELEVNYIFELKDGQLVARVGNGEEHNCTLSDVDIYTGRMGTYRFQRTIGQVSGMELDSGRVINVKFEKK
ncbi:serine hydrolase domain-containing protein [Aureitalea marina]|nr:serine hydrolase domain-containing protein [Aureitalea marina]